MNNYARGTNAVAVHWALFVAGGEISRTKRRFRGVMVAVVFLALAAATAAGQTCPGDNDNDGEVTVDEIVASVFSALNGCAEPGGRFTDNGDGTITDHQTGLMWEKKVPLDMVRDYANLHDPDNDYVWSGYCVDHGVARGVCQPDAASEATCIIEAEGVRPGCAQCVSGGCYVYQGSSVWQWLAALNAENFAGYSDWRLPRVTELQTILVDDWPTATPPLVDTVFRGAFCGGACTNYSDPACGCVVYPGYWSASTSREHEGYAWMVNFFDGGVGLEYKSNGGQVRAVRSVAPTASMQMVASGATHPGVERRGITPMVR